MGDIVTLLGAGLMQAFEPLNLFMIFAGCLAGLFIGAMPGLGLVHIASDLFDHGVLVVDLFLDILLGLLHALDRLMDVI